MSSLPTWSGWMAVALFLAAATVPLTHRLLVGRRAAPSSRPIRGHVLVGLATTLAALGHTMSVLPSLGSAGAVGGGTIALAPGALAFFLLFAHVGVGLQLRSPRLRDRARMRRRHVLIATGIAVAVAAHVVALREGASGGRSGQRYEGSETDGSRGQAPCRSRHTRSRRKHAESRPHEPAISTSLSAITA